MNFTSVVSMGIFLNTVMIPKLTKTSSLRWAFFITWSVKPWGSAQGYKRPPQGVNEVIVVAQYIA